MSDLLKRLFGDDFAIPYSKKNRKRVLNHQPVEKVMFVYKTLAEAGGDQYSQLSAWDYADAAQKLFEKLGVSSSIVSGSLKAHPEQSHFWNIVTIDGYVFHFDVYFANPERLKELNDASVLEPFIIDSLAYNFFCVSTQRVISTHIISGNDPSIDCKHSLSHELVRSLAAMSVHAHFIPPGTLMGLIAYPLLPFIDNTISQTPITLSFE